MHASTSFVVVWVSTTLNRVFDILSSNEFPILFSQVLNILKTKSSSKHSTHVVTYVVDLVFLAKEHI